MPVLCHNCIFFLANHLDYPRIFIILGAVNVRPASFARQEVEELGILIGFNLFECQVVIEAGLSATNEGSIKSGNSKPGSEDRKEKQSCEE